MALQTKTISANGSKGHHKFTLTVTEDSTSTTNNTSSLSWSLKISPIGNGYDWVSNQGKVKYSVVFNGTTYSGAITSYDGKSTVTIKSGTATCTHDADGTKTISFSFSITDSTGWSFAPGSASASGTMELTSIPRQATITSVPNFTDVENPVLRYSNPAGNAVTSLKACISFTGSTDDIGYRDILKTGTSYTFSLTEAERNVLRNATTSNSRKVYFFLWTVIGGVDYRVYKEATFSISNGEPIITASVIDDNPETVALTGDSNKLVKFCSNALVEMTAEAQKGASINEDLYVIRNGDQTGYGTTWNFNSIEDNTFTFTAEDSRGNVGRTVLTPEMVEYIKPTCQISKNRPDALGNMTVSCYGNFFNQSFGAVQNTLTVQYRYKVSGGAYSSWTSMTVTKSGNTYYASADFVIPNFNQSFYYDFETQAIDLLGIATSDEASVKSIPIFHWGENDFVFEVPVTFNAGANGFSNNDIDGDCNISGNLRLKGSSNWGNYIRLGDGDYCYISEPSDDVMEIYARSGLRLKSASVEINGQGIASGTWTPTLNSTAAVSSYTNRDGWYQKIGNVVTIGWRISATINSGYDTTELLITGIPFTPKYPAFGGGVAYNIKISGGFNFEAWAVDTNGKISARLQPSNNTAAGNLSIASTSYYPVGGGTVTLGGTICYQTT